MLDVRVYDRAGTFLDAVPDAIDPQFQEQLNVAGSFTFGLQVDSKTWARTPSLLDYGNIVKLDDGNHVFAGRIEGKQRKFVAERSAQICQVSGRGILAVLEDAIVYPEYGLIRFRGDSRPFNFASKEGPWRVTAEWSEPMFGPWGATDVGWRKGSPADWPDPQGEWMWPSPGPTDLNAQESDAYFRRDFTTATSGYYRFYCTGDNEFELWVNGSLVLSGDSWATSYSVDVWVPAGDTLVAIKGHNWPQLPSTTSTAGVLFAMYTIAGDGTTGSILRRSTSGAGWLARMDNGDPPGWSPGLVLSTLIGEAQASARGGGVAALAPLSVSWTDTADTDGVAWTTASPAVVDRTLPIAADLLSVATQLAETSADIRIEGSTLAVEMRLHQGADKTVDPGAVVLYPAGSLVDADYQGDASAQRSVLLVQGADGQWYERGITPSPPRREAGLQVGSATSQRQIDLVVDQTLAEHGSPTEQFTVQVTGGSPVPFVDFTVGDTVLIPNPDDGGLVAQRVVAISVKQQDRQVLYTPELSAVLKSREQRQVQTLTSMLGGTLGGRVANASPVAVSSRVQAAVARAASSGTDGVVAYRDLLAADGSTTSFALTRLPLLNAVWVYVNGLASNEGTDYTIDYATGVITFTTAPATTDKVWARYLSFGVVPPPPGAATFHQSTFSANNGAPRTLAFNNPVNAGAVVVAVMGFQSTGELVSSMSGLGATWSNAYHIERSWAGQAALDIWVGIGCTGGSTVTVSGTYGNAVLYLLEFGGIAGTVKLANGTYADTGTPNTGPWTVPAGSILAVAGFDSFQGAGAGAGTPAGWNALPVESVGNTILGPGYLDVTSLQGTNVSFGASSDPAASWVAGLVCLS